MKLSKQAAEERQELTAGTHRAEVLSVEETESRAGKAMLVVKLEVGEAKKWLNHYVPLGVAFRVNELIDCLGEETTEMEGKFVEVDIVDEEYNGRNSLKVKSLRRLEGLVNEEADDDIPF